MANRGLTGRSSVSLSALAAAMVLAGLLGCTPPPPSKDALFYYLSVTRYDGAVRRAWPAGQAYLDGVMKQYRALEKATDPLRKHLVAESLWPTDDPRWGNAEALAEHVKELDELLKEDGERAKAQAEAVKGLAEAFEQVPEDLEFRNEQGRAEFVARLWTALTDGRGVLEGKIQELEQLVSERRELYAAVQALAAGPTTSQPETRLVGVGPLGEYAGRHAALLETLQKRREAFVEYAEHRLGMLERFLRDISKREERQEYELLTAERQYLRGRLEQIPKSLRVRAEALEKNIKQFEKALGEPDADESYLKRRIEFSRKWGEALRTQAGEWDARVGKILGKEEQPGAGASGGAED